MIYKVKPKGNFLAAFGASAVVRLAEDGGLAVDYDDNGRYVVFTDEHGDSEVICFDDEETLVVDTTTGSWSLMTTEEFHEAFHIVG
jgi:hypothetical protein